MSTSTALPMGPPMPTLLTRMSSRPQASTVALTEAALETGSAASAAATIDVPPSASIIALVASAHSFIASSNATLAPSRASNMAAALPLPMPSSREPAPVTIATLSLRPIWGIRSRSSVLVRYRPASGRTRLCLVSHPHTIRWPVQEGGR
jgi:hypothetical protein